LIIEHFIGFQPAIFLPFQSQLSGISIAPQANEERTKSEQRADKQRMTINPENTIPTPSFIFIMITSV
jgi:hypothetical protein